MFVSYSLLAVMLIGVYILGLITTPFLFYVILKTPTRLQKSTQSHSTNF
ncbi:MAG: hypothetical protein KC421_24745 [Anaerolineales bacterium]|nr:hypothetical protein [Anaerolineales bacterium]